MRHARVLLSSFVFLASCAAFDSGQTAADRAVLLRAELAAAERARSALAPGSTKADVLAALGKGQVISFDSGYEVWVYRHSAPGKPPSGKTELLVLIDPRGMLAKIRLRAPPA